MPDIHTIFPLANTWLLLLSFACCAASLILFSRNKHNWSLVSLFFTAFFLRLFMAHLDPFLHEWDERFHALVARNMMHDPFKPMLRLTDWAFYDYREWSRNHIWLHKQPLFMWQMALSMKLFGVSAFAIRYPAVLMGSIGVIFIYRITHLMTANRHIALLAALLMCFSYYPLELMSGLYGMDQNDSAFSFYVLASIWAYAEYTNRKILQYAILIGFFAGCAILIKWLPGLLVFSGWCINLFPDYRKPGFKKELIHYLTSLLVCALVFLPWQVYIIHTFPAEAWFEYDYNIRRLHEAVDGRSGTWLYYIQHSGLYFGEYLYWLLPMGLIVIAALKKYRNKLSLALVSCFIIALFFFSVISKTMVDAYPMPVVPLGYIFMAIAVFEILDRVKILKYGYIPVTLLLSYSILCLPEITNQHDPANVGHNNWDDWTRKRNNDAVYRNLRKYLPADVKIVLNAIDYTDIMFYNNDIDAYFSYISSEDFAKITKQHLRVGVFNTPNNPMPDYVWSYDNIYVIQPEIKKW